MKALFLSCLLGGLVAVSPTNLTAASSSLPSSFLKGVTISCQTWGIEWQTPEMEAALDELKSLGVNSIAIHPYAQIQEDGHLFTGRGPTAGTTHITTPLRWARERGMSVMARDGEGNRWYTCSGVLPPDKAIRNLPRSFMACRCTSSVKVAASADHCWMSLRTWTSGLANIEFPPPIRATVRS